MTKGSSCSVFLGFVGPLISFESALSFIGGYEEISFLPVSGSGLGAILDYGATYSFWFPPVHSGDGIPDLGWVCSWVQAACIGLPIFLLRLKCHLLQEFFGQFVVQSLLVGLVGNFPGIATGFSGRCNFFAPERFGGLHVSHRDAFFGCLLEGCCKPGREFVESPGLAVLGPLFNFAGGQLIKQIPFCLLIRPSQFPSTFPLPAFAGGLQGQDHEDGQVV